MTVAKLKNSSFQLVLLSMSLLCLFHVKVLWMIEFPVSVSSQCAAVP